MMFSRISSLSAMTLSSASKSVADDTLEIEYVKPMDSHNGLEQNDSYGFTLHMEEYVGKSVPHRICLI
jgi:hypothetical protein